MGREDFVAKFGARIVLGNCRNFYYISSSAVPDMNRIRKVLRHFTDRGSGEDPQELPLSAGYDILLSLLVPEPEVLNADWDVREGVKGQWNWEARSK